MDENENLEALDYESIQEKRSDELLELLERAGARSAEAGTAALVAAIETAADRLPERPEGTEDPDAAP